jgi:DNA adenine methylase
MAKPFFKWVGGKAGLVPQLVPLLPSDYATRRHVELFVGGGALFFAMEPKTALLNDINGRLINTYKAVLANPGSVIQGLRRLIKTHSSENYYKRRDQYNGDPKLSHRQKASLFLYLNKTCYNGLYRENRGGGFNVPCGRYKTLNVDADAIRDAACVLAYRAQLRNLPYRYLLDDLGEDDFIYLDPPYDGTFTSYSKTAFGEEQQRSLAEDFVNLSNKGASVMLSNSDTPLIRQLYRGFNTTEVQAPRAVNSKGSGRGAVTELVIRNYG